MSWDVKKISEIKLNMCHGSEAGMDNVHMVCAPIQMLFPVQGC